MYCKKILSVVLLAVLNTGCGGNSGDFTLAPLPTTTLVIEHREPWGPQYFPKSVVDADAEEQLNEIYNDYLLAKREGNLLPEPTHMHGSIYVAFKDNDGKYVALTHLNQARKYIPDDSFHQYLRGLKNTLGLSTFLVPKYFKESPLPFASEVLVAPNGGDDLEVYVKNKGNISLSAFEQVIQDLQTFHTRGHAYHRDIKPQNLTYRDDQVHLIDFGSALTEKERHKYYNVSYGITKEYLPKSLHIKQISLEHHSSYYVNRGIKSEDYHLLSHYLRAADEYALLLSMIIAVDDGAGDYKTRKKEILAAAERCCCSYIEAPDFKERLRILIDWIKKYQKDAFAGEQLEFLLKDPVTYAETYYDSKHRNLADLLDFNAV